MAPIAVLCLGNQKPRRLAIAPAERCVADMWAPGAMDGIGADEPVLIVGTGSTGIDALLELHHRGHRGTIHLLSRRGLLPLIDAPPQAYAFKRTSIAAAPRLREVARLLRAGGGGGGRRGTFLAERDRCLPGLPAEDLGGSVTSRAQPVPAPPATLLADPSPPVGARHRRAAGSPACRETGGGPERSPACRAGWTATALPSTSPGPTAHRSAFRSAGSSTAPGPEEDLSRVGDPLTDDLFRSGAARPGAFGVGLDVDADARLLRADGTPSARLFVLGGATRARFGEVTSAPQIRRRASALVDAIASVLHEMEPQR